MKLLLALIFTICSFLSIAQPTDTGTVETFDFSKFTDAVQVKRYCGPKINAQTPQRFVSVGYEYQGEFNMPNIPNNFATPITYTVNSISALRVTANIPVISKDYLVWQVGANANLAKINTPTTYNNTQFASLLNTNMNSIGINTTVFKPLNEKKFIIFQANIDGNEFGNSLLNFNNKSITWGVTAIYGTKKSDDEMLGYGISRSYRAGQAMFFPVLFWNKNFNKKWGMELLLPARGHVRYQPNQNNIYQLGFELEGNQYFASINNKDVFLQRGELKPRIMLDKKLTNFFWLNIQGGFRYNWRFEANSIYNGKDEATRIFKSSIGNPLYFNISLNFVSP